MRNTFLTLVAAATMLVGGLVWTDTAEARPRWRGGYYYGAPAVRYYRPYGYYRPYSYHYGPRYYSRSYYGYPSYGYPYYGNPYRYSWGPRAGVYFRF